MVSFFSNVHLSLGKISNLATVLQRGWNHQLVKDFKVIFSLFHGFFNHQQPTIWENIFILLFQSIWSKSKLIYLNGTIPTAVVWGVERLKPPINTAYFLVVKSPVFDGLSVAGWFPQFYRFWFGLPSPPAVRPEEWKIHWSIRREAGSMKNSWSGYLRCVGQPNRGGGKRISRSSWGVVVFGWQLKG